MLDLQSSETIVAGATFTFFIENEVRVSEIISLSTLNGRAVKCKWEAMVLASAFNLLINNIWRFTAASTLVAVASLSK